MGANVAPSDEIVTYRAWPDIDRVHSIGRMVPTQDTSPSDPRKQFGERLIRLRKQRGWSQETLALESGIARSYLGGVERGQRNIALINICRLAEALMTPPSELLKFDAD